MTPDAIAELVLCDTNRRQCEALLNQHFRWAVTLKVAGLGEAEARRIASEATRDALIALKSEGAEAA